MADRVDDDGAMCVTLHMKHFVTALALALGYAAGAQDLTGYERVLIPIYAPEAVQGVGSSLFTTNLHVFTPNSVAFWPDASGGAHVGAQIGVLNPGMNTPFLGSIAEGSARVMFISRSASSLSFDLKVTSIRDLKSLSPRGPDFTYAWLPVIRENKFLSGAVRVLGVPFAYFNEQDIGVGPCCESREQFRHTLRIYDIDGSGETEVDVRILHPNAPGGILSERRVRLGSRDGADASFPYYAQVRIDNPCFSRGAGHVGCVSAFGAVEILPTNAHQKYWAFVTSTHNITHDIALSLP